MPWLRDMPLTTTNRRSSISASTAQSKRRIEVGVRQPHLSIPVVGDGLGPILSLLDPAQPQGDEGQVESPRQAAAQPFADELGHTVRPIRHRGHETVIGPSPTCR